MRKGLSSDQICLLANINSRHGKMRSGRQERPFYKEETQAAPSDTTKLGKKIFGSHLALDSMKSLSALAFTCLWVCGHQSAVPLSLIQDSQARENTKEGGGLDTECLVLKQ